jgi:hypothetical protein
MAGRGALGADAGTWPGRLDALIPGGDLRLSLDRGCCLLVDREARLLPDRRRLVGPRARIFESTIAVGAGGGYSAATA